MSEWWTYTLSDFLLFSARTYYRLIELYNVAIWPAQLAAVGLGLTAWTLLRRDAVWRGRVVTSILAGCWLWVAVLFHAHRYAAINWAAAYFAWGFGLEAALLIGIHGAGGLSFQPTRDPASRAGSWILLFALAMEPLSGLVAGRGWRQLEVFGVTPDPTAVATLGALLLAGGRWRWATLIIPALWCFVSGATLLAMKAPDAWIPPLAAALAISLAVRQRWGRRRAQRLS